MGVLDIVLLIILGGFVLYGFLFGLIHSLGVVVGMVAGAFLAGRLFEPVAVRLVPLFGGNANLGRVIVFLLIFGLMNRIVGLVFSLLDRLFQLLTFIPFLSSVNRLSGAILGLLEGVVVVGGALYLATKYPITASFTAALAQSTVAAPLLVAASIIVPFLPVIVREVESALPRSLR